MNFETARHHMIQQQLRTCEHMSPEIVDLLYADRREHYVPPAYRALAFADTQLPLSPTAAMLTPKLETRILQAARLRLLDRVLVVGAGSGHLSALLAEEAEQVWAFEIDPALAERARQNLAADGVANVDIVVGDGLSGYAEHASFDFILIAGAVQAIPAVLQEQLKPGGHLLAFVGSAPITVLRQLTRQADGSLLSKDLLETLVPQLHQAARPARFQF